MNLTVVNAVKETFITALKNVPSFIGAALLWVLTCWIPYINVGTTIALFYAMPIELSKGTVMNPLSIFDGKYRKYMGEFFSIIGLMSISIIPALCFMVVPAIIISIGWCLAICIMIDKELNPAEAMTESTRCTYGYKWTIFGANILIYLGWVVVSMIVLYLFAAIKVDILVFIAIVASLIVGITLQVCFTGVIYRYLVRLRNVPPTTPDIL